MPAARLERGVDHPGRKSAILVGHPRNRSAEVTKFGVVFLVVLLGSPVAAAALPARGRSLLHLDRGVMANERLTAMTGALLFVLLGAVAVTTLSMHVFLSEHYIVGLLLVPPVMLKLAATGYRFARYYTRSVAYRLAGPPPALMRLVVAPVLVASTLAVFATGIELWLFGLRYGPAWMTAHTFSAVVFMLAAGGHVLWHLRRSAQVAADEIVPAQNRFGAGLTTRSLLVASVVLGAILAVSSLLYATPFPPAAAGG